MENFTMRVWGLPESSKPRSTVSKRQWRELTWAGKQPGPAAPGTPEARDVLCLCLPEQGDTPLTPGEECGFTGSHRQAACPPFLANFF